MLFGSNSAQRIPSRSEREAPRRAQSAGRGDPSSRMSQASSQGLRLADSSAGRRREHATTKACRREHQPACVAAAAREEEQQPAKKATAKSSRTREHLRGRRGRMGVFRKRTYFSSSWGRLANDPASGGGGGLLWRELLVPAHDSAACRASRRYLGDPRILPRLAAIIGVSWAQAHATLHALLAALHWG